MSTSSESADSAGSDEEAFEEAPRLSDEGRRLLDHGRFSEAADLLRQAVELDPADAEAWQQLGQALCQSGQLEHAVEAFHQAVLLRPDEATTLMELGRILSQLGQLQEALHALDRALDLDPSNAKALILKGEVLGQHGDYLQAISLLRRAVQLEPENAEAWAAIDRTLDRTLQETFEMRRVAVKREGMARNRERAAEKRKRAAEEKRKRPAEVREARAAPPWVESTADRDDFSHYASRLRWAREQGLRALEVTYGRPVEAEWGETLLPAARQLLEALSSIAEADGFWQILQDRTAPLHARDLRKVQEILDQDLAALLAYMGYRPPPPPQVLELELKDALADVLEARGDAFVGEARRAQRHLAVFTYRLRRVINEAAEAHPQGKLLDKRARGDFQAERPWRRLRAAVDKGTRVAGPAALAAGITTLVFPPAGPAAAAAGFGAAATATGQEFLKQGTEFAATSLLDKTLADEPALATAHEQRSSARKRAGNAVQDLRSALNADERTPQWGKRVDVFAIECVSALYGLLQAEEGPSSRSRHALPATVERARDLAHQVRDLVRDASRLSDSDLARARARHSDQLAGVERELGEILKRAHWSP